MNFFELLFSLYLIGVQATADSALFIHQMIPHHVNAVNTARTLLKTGNLLCPDLTDTTNPDCVLEGILLEISASQNYQIQKMHQFLMDRQFPLTDNCDVYVETVNEEKTSQGSSQEGDMRGSGALELTLTIAKLSAMVALAAVI